MLFEFHFENGLQWLANNVYTLCQDKIADLGIMLINKTKFIKITSLCIKMSKQFDISVASNLQCLQ